MSSRANDVKPAYAEVFRWLTIGGSINHQPEIRGNPGHQWDPEFYDNNYDAVSPKLLRSMISKGYLTIERGEVKITPHGQQRYKEYRDRLDRPYGSK